MNSFSSFRPHAGMYSKLPLSDALIIIMLLAILSANLLAVIHILNNFLVAEIPIRHSTINEGIVGVPVHKNPLFATSIVEQDIAALTHAGLLQRNMNGVFTPQLAADWKQDSKNQYTLHLRKNVFFHDGTPLTTADVLYTIRIIGLLPEKNEYRIAWNGVEVSAPDEHTVIVTVPEGNLHFPEGFTVPILPKHIWQKIPEEDWQKYKGSGAYTGAGPYMHRSETLTMDERLTTLTLEEFPGYALGRPYVEKITFHFFATPSELLKAYTNGTINALHSIAPAEVAALMRQNETDHTVYTARTNRIFGIFFNAGDGRTLENPFLRSILAQRIQREHIVTNIFQEQATAIQGPLATDEDIKEQHITTEEIQQTLEDIGWKFDGASGYREKDGVPLRLSFVFPDIEEMRQIAEILVTEWKKFGVDIEMRALPQIVMKNIIDERQFDIILHGYTAEKPKNLGNLWKSGDENNIASLISFGSPTLNSLLEELEHSSPPERYAEKADEMNDSTWRKMVYTDIKVEMKKSVPAVFLYSPHFLYILPGNIISDDLRNTHQNRITKPRDRFSAVHKWHTKKEKVWKFLVKE